jgi:2-polyprenyl-3-methyl-5-hydroxy-6-metoxy-1,4-benzoquinol methylase
MKLVGWRAILLHDDPCAYQRFKWLKKNLTRGNIRTLDAGCGEGAFTLYAAMKGNDAVGFSFDDASNQVAYRYARQLKCPNAKFVTGDLRKLDKQAAMLGKFDQIICFETIEHIMNDKKLICDLASLLNPGGRLLLTTPNKNYKHLYGDSISLTEDGGHVRWGYTHDELKTMFSANGLEVVKQDFIGGMVSQKLTNLLRFIGKKSNRRIAWTATLPLRTLSVMDPALTHLLRYPFHSIGVVGIKR